MCFPFLRKNKKTVEPVEPAEPAEPQPAKPSKYFNRFEAKYQARSCKHKPLLTRELVTGLKPDQRGSVMDFVREMV